MVRSYQVNDGLGVHARPAAALVKAFGAISGPVSLVYNGREVDAHSILSIMTLGIQGGVSFQLHFADSEQAVVDGIEREMEGLIERVT